MHPTILWPDTVIYATIIPASTLISLHVDAGFSYTYVDKSIANHDTAIGLYLTNTCTTEIQIH